MNNTSNFTLRSSLLAVLAAAALAGCSSVKLDDKPPVESRTGLSASELANSNKAGTGGTAQSNVASVDLTNGAGDVSKLSRTIYFDFDSYVVKDDYRPTIEGFAKALAADRKKHLSVEGHTDERGGREYNLALGQKRAEAVTKQLALLGAGDAQVEAVSFGKERPAVQGSDEAAWAKNRRAELNYK
ncbi:MAG TPA: peptidoglycan-associated lipoprotein Pal [Burkholderiaceae bacterium]|jgi:peptidoglycan-associated lipoprotein